MWPYIVFRIVQAPKAEFVSASAHMHELLKRSV